MAELIIDRNYYNKLDIEGFSKMMSSPSYCYKFYWLEAIVQLISANRTEATYDEIINKMIVNAWFPVQEYHIHLSGIYGEGEVKDNLEKAVSRLFKLSDLPSNADEIQIINKLNEFSDDKELHFYKTELTKNVPYKALSGFANKGTEKIDLNSSAGRMIAYYNRLSGSEILLPYTFNDEKSLKKVVSFNDGWIQMIQDNMVSILGWIKYEKVKWLQNNNPEVPGIVYKLAQDDEKARKLLIYSDFNYDTMYLLATDKKNYTNSKVIEIKENIDKNTIPAIQNLNNNDINNEKVFVRLVFDIHNETMIIGGDGTSTNPFILKGGATPCQ